MSAFRLNEEIERKREMVRNIEGRWRLRVVLKYRGHVIEELQTTRQ